MHGYTKCKRLGLHWVGDSHWFNSPQDRLCRPENNVSRAQLFPSMPFRLQNHFVKGSALPSSKYKKTTTKLLEQVANGTCGGADGSPGNGARGSVHRSRCSSHGTVCRCPARSLITSVALRNPSWNLISLARSRWPWREPPSQSDRSVSTAPTAEPTRLSDLRPRLRRWTRQPDVTTLLPQSSSKQRFGLVRQRPRLASQKQAASLQRLKLARQ